MLNQVMSILNMEQDFALYALLIVRYRSSEAAIEYIVQPDFGLYRHPFIAYVPRYDAEDLEFADRTPLCYLCEGRQHLHYQAEANQQQSQLGHELDLMFAEEMKENQLLQQEKFEIGRSKSNRVEKH